MTAHALRTLVKQGDATAMALLGFRATPKMSVTPIKLNKKTVEPGNAIEFQFNVTAQRDERLMIDYAIEFVKSGGKTSEKIFKIKHLELAKGETQTIKKRHPFRAGEFIANGGFKIGFGMAPLAAEKLAQFVLTGENTIPPDFDPTASL